MKVKKEYKNKTKDLLKNIDSFYTRRQIVISKIKSSSIILDEYVEELEILNEKISIFENSIKGLDEAQLCLLNYKYLNGNCSYLSLESKLFLKERTIKNLHSKMVDKLTYILFGDNSLEICG